MLEPKSTIEHRHVLQGLTEQELQALTAHGYIICCPAGEPVVMGEDAGREIFIVLEGSLRILVQSLARELGRLVRILGPGDIFGEVAFLTDGLRCASVSAMDDVRLLILDAKPLDRLTSGDAQLAPKLFRNIAQIVPLRLRDAVRF